MNLDRVHTIEAKDNLTLQKNTENFSRKDIVGLSISKEDKERLDSINNYIDEFNKTLDSKNDEKPIREGNVQTKSKTFWDRVKGLFNK